MSEENLYGSEDPLWRIHMQTLMKRKRSMEIAQIIDEALWKYYFEKGMEVPQWRRNADPKWWSEYLINLGIDPQNP